MAPACDLVAVEVGVEIPLELRSDVLEAVLLLTRVFDEQVEHWTLSAPVIARGLVRSSFIK